jgi:hypothetical protein
MVGKVPIKVSGPVKHGDFIYASNKLPGIGVPGTGEKGKKILILLLFLT